MTAPLRLAKTVPTPRKQDYIEVFEGIVKGQWYWRLRAPNHKIVAGGEEWYARRGGAVGAVKKLQRRKSLGVDLKIYWRDALDHLREVG